MTDLDTFKALLTHDSPPGDLVPPLAALWWEAKGDWDRGHGIVQQHDDTDSAWVHAYLHRVEGDLPNARYWYARAGRKTAAGAFEVEWDAIAEVLLGA